MYVKSVPLRDETTSGEGKRAEQSAHSTWRYRTGIFISVDLVYCVISVTETANERP